MSFEGIPHMSIIDDEYNGFYIPKGTSIIGNAWLVTTTYTMILFPVLKFLFFI